jgi:hypothetical protein
MRKLIAALMMLAASATAAAAASKAKAPLWVGDWCLVESFSNGHDAISKKNSSRGQIDTCARPVIVLPTAAASPSARAVFAVSISRSTKTGCRLKAGHPRGDLRLALTRIRLGA